MKGIRQALLFSALGSLAVAACAQGGQFNNAPNKLPAGVSVSAIAYDGINDDLLTAGLGKTGIGGARPARSTRPKRRTCADSRSTSTTAR